MSWNAREWARPLAGGTFCAAGLAGLGLLAAGCGSKSASPSVESLGAGSTASTTTTTPAAGGSISAAVIGSG
jgi:hypothetical protein